MLGAIHSVKLKNFMVYSHTLFKPCKGLNVVIGSNGSGKSTLLLAIIIGVGGQLEDIGRQKHLTDFIKENENSAEITIALAWDSGKKLLETILQRDSREPKYFVDTKEVTREHVVDLARSANIVPSNLCQFLPQEKVSQFSQMDHTVLFKNILKSIGDEAALEAYQNLGPLQEELNEVVFKVKNLEERMEVKSNEVQALTYIKDAISDRDESLNKKRCLDALDAICKLKKASEEESDYKSKKVELTVTLDQATKKKKWFEEESTKLEEEQRKLTQQHREFTLEANQLSKEAFKETRGQMESMATSQAVLAREKVDLNERLVKPLEEAQVALRAYEKEHGDLKQLRFQLEEATKECEALEDRANEASLRRLQLRLEKSREKATDLEGKIRKGDFEALSHLRGLSHDSFKAVQWLKSNQDKFSNPDDVHNPMMLLLDVQDQNYSKHLERFLGRTKLVAFVCGNTGDAKVLMNARKSNHFRDVNVIDSSGFQFVRSFNSQRREDYFFLSDLIGPKCPPAIVTCLKKQEIDTIPVFTNPKSPHIQGFVNSHRPHFVQDQYYSYISSRYSKEKTEKLEYRIPEAKYLAAPSPASGSDTSNPLKIELESERQQQLVLEGQIREQRVMVNDLKACQNKRNKLQEVFNKAEKLQAVYSDLTFRLKKAAPVYKSADAKEKIRQTLEEIPRRTKAIIEKMNKLSELEKKLKTCEMELSAFQNSGDEAFLEEEAEAIGSFEEAQKKLSNNIAGYKKAVEQQRRLREHLWAKHGQWAKKEFKSWGAFFDNMPESMLDQLEAITDTGFSFGRNDPLPTVKDVEKAHRGWAQIYDTKGKSKNANEEVRYQTAIQELENMERSKVGLEKDKSVAESKVRECAGVISTQKDRFEKLSSKFSQLMASMSFAGELAMVETEKQDCPFKVEVKVKFREQSELTVLRGSDQSGGEKAISTACLILALKSFEGEKSSMPFCCVDEINAGMDEINEMRVWKLILASQSGPTACQTFYFSPTFSEKLKLTDDTDSVELAVHICNRGDIRGQASNTARAKRRAPLLSNVLKAARKTTFSPLL